MPTLPRRSFLYTSAYRCIMPAVMLKPEALTSSFSVLPSESLLNEKAQTAGKEKSLSGLRFSSFFVDKRLTASSPAVWNPVFWSSSLDADARQSQKTRQSSDSFTKLRAGWSASVGMDSMQQIGILGSWPPKFSWGLSYSRSGGPKHGASLYTNAAHGERVPDSEAGGGLGEGIFRASVDRGDSSGVDAAEVDGRVEATSGVERETEAGSAEIGVDAAEVDGRVEATSGVERETEASSAEIGVDAAEVDGRVEATSGVERETEASSAEIDADGRARERRRRSVGASVARHVPGPLPDLLTVPGIGPRNMEKLVAKGIAKLAELKQLYRDKFRDNGADKMVEYLRSSVGILHKHHAASITNYIRDKVEAELAPQDGSRTKKRLTFCVEGNISVGKSTFLQKIASETIELQDLVEIVPEPVAKWQDVGSDHFNILESFYAEPERYAYTFQNYVFVTRLMQERESANGVKPLRLMERSVFSDRMVFVRAVHEAKWMSEMEISIYDSWFNPVVSELPGLVPDAFIYLRASPDTCLRRLQSRKRPEEHGVSIDYLQGLHEKHEQWLLPAQSRSGGVLSVSPALKEPMSPRIRDRVFYLEGDHVHSCIQKVPALMLDCDTNIDFAQDFEAKAEYAKQVAEFFEYVQRTKDNASGGGNQLIVPQPGGLLGPDGARLLAAY